MSSPRSGVDETPGPDDLVVLTWNAHMFEGDLAGLIADLRAGRLTGGNPCRTSSSCFRSSIGE